MSKSKVVKFVIGFVAGYLGAKVLCRGRKARAPLTPEPAQEG